MKIEIEVVSTEIITPSSPTPNDLSNHNLSYLDQISPPAFICLPLLYKATSKFTKSEISSRLKKTLSKTLSLYYPLAGRLVDNSYVNCNDQGITYIEAQANCTLMEVVNEPLPHEIDKLFPRKIVDNVSDHCSIIQATFFECGGLAIGVALSHKLGDGWSISLFINCWAAISRGDGDTHIRIPLFNGATIFSSKSDLVGSNPEMGMMSKEGIITKRFVFTATKINDLRDIYTNTARATRIEALTTFIFTRFMVSTKNKDDPKRIFTLYHAVNIRKRVVPPLSDDLFGNLVLTTKAVPVMGDGEEEGYEIVQKLREAIRRVGGDYVTTLREGSQTFDSKTFGGEVVPFYFTSLCGFPIFEADFGWGKPVWSGPGTSCFKNVVSFMDSSSCSSGGGGGIQAWVCLKVEDMAKFEVDEEFLAYAATSMAESG